ncbi:hypothetical protein GEMRC1_004520 [Eukaryota sp. GEM-RC1]
MHVLLIFLSVLSVICHSYDDDYSDYSYNDYYYYYDESPSFDDYYYETDPYGNTYYEEYYSSRDDYYEEYSPYNDDIFDLHMNDRYDVYDSTDLYDFNDDHHAYFTDDDYISVSQLIDDTYGTFNAESVAKKVNQRKDSPYYGMGVEAIMEQWDDERELGTELHSDIENFYKEGTIVKGKDFQAFLQFHRDVIIPQKITPLKIEETLFNEDGKIVGTIDFLGRDANGDVVLFDWKRTKTIKEDRYDMQMNLYEELLHKNGIAVKRKAIVRIHDGKYSVHEF